MYYYRIYDIGKLLFSDEAADGRRDIVHRGEKNEHRNGQRSKVGGTEEFGYFRPLGFPAE